MDVTLVVVPYDLGRAEVGSGRGPRAYLECGAVDALRLCSHDVQIAHAERRHEFRTELDAVLDVNTSVAAHVAAAVHAGRLPIVLAGNCNAALGVRAGLLTGKPYPLGGLPALAWFDAHGDFNTPEISRSGYLDGMPLAMLTNRAHPQAWTSLGGWPLPERLALHVGARDVDPAEEVSLQTSTVLTVDAAQIARAGIGPALVPALDELALRANDQTADLPPLHLHVDIDVLDPAVAPSVMFPAPGGLTLADLLSAIDMIGARFRLEALSVASFLPGGAGDGTTCAAGTAIMATVASIAAAS